MLQCAATLYQKFSDLGNALRCALRLNDISLIETIFQKSGGSDDASEISSVQRQLAYLLGKQGVILPGDDDMDMGVTEMLWNTRLSAHVMVLGGELDIKEPKVRHRFIGCLLAVLPPMDNTTQAFSVRNGHAI